MIVVQGPQELNMFGRVEGLVYLKDKIGVHIMEACPPKLDHRSSTDLGSTDRTISLDAPLQKSNFGAHEISHD